MHWTFKKTAPGDIKMDHIESEFFKGTGKTKEEHGKVDSFERECNQNSLDASFRNQKVKLRFHISSSNEKLSIGSSEKYLLGLEDHLAACGNRFLEKPTPMNFLVVEDFGTVGLCGDPTRYTDPQVDMNKVPPELQESFYYFWRNIGRSSKGSQYRGSWGLGKTVFPSSSQINAFWGLTIRPDGRELLMGQAIFKHHHMDDNEFAPEGFFHSNKEGGVQIPFEDDPLVNQFKKDFKLKRTTEPGLSIVVPYHLPFFNKTDLARSVIVHFFLSIIKDQLEIEISEGKDKYVINATTIEQISNKISWEGRVEDKKNTPPPFELVRWAIAKQKSTNLIKLASLSNSKAPEWTKKLFESDNHHNLLIDEFQSGKKLAFRVPLVLNLKNSSTPTESYFDLFIEKTESQDDGIDYYIRDGMTISQINSVKRMKGIKALVLVEDEPLSIFLGQTEGPAHINWNSNEEKPDQYYKRGWKARLKFIKKSIKDIAQLLTPSPEGLNKDLLKSVFNSPDESTTGSLKPETPSPNSGENSKKDEESKFPDIISKPKKVIISKIKGQGGFQVVPGPAYFSDKYKIISVTIKVAYNTGKGSPLKKYSPYDFNFSKSSGNIILEGKDVSFIEKDKNTIIFNFSSSLSTLKVYGFNQNLDLFISNPKIKDESYA